MHVIPESWSHLHILIGLFPLVGLLFVLGFYATAIVTNNDGLKRICLLVIVGLGVLSIPTYISGMASIMAVSARAGVTEDLINSHYNWSLYALLILIVAAIAAGYEWMRSNNSGRFSQNAIHLVLGLSLLTLLLMVVAGETGWRHQSSGAGLPRGRHRGERLAVGQRHSGRPGHAAGVVALPHHPEPLPLGRAGHRSLLLHLRHCHRQRRDEADEPRGLHHLRHPRRPDLRHGRLLDVGADRSDADTEHLPGRDQRAPRHGALDSVRSRGDRRHRVDRALALPLSQPLLVALDLRDLGLCADHARLDRRNRPSRRPDQPSGDPHRASAPDAIRGRVPVPADRAADQQRAVVRALADPPFLWLLPDLRHGHGRRAARVRHLEVDAVLRHPPHPPARA